MADFEITQGDTSPSLSATLEDAVGDPVDLNDATVQLIMEPQRGADLTPTATGSAFIEDPPVAGNVRFDWVVGQTDVPGGYDGRWLVTFQSGRKESFPNDGPFTIAIHARSDPQPVVPLLASTEAFAESRNVDHDPADTHALRALEDASAMFRSLAQQTISRVVDDVVELEGNDTSRLWLPERPVVSVKDVSIIYDDTTTPLVFVDSDVISTRRGLLTTFTGYEWGGYDASVRLTYTHGYLTIPADIVAVVCAMAERNMSETVATPDRFGSVVTGRTTGLTDEEWRVIKRYRPVMR